MSLFSSNDEHFCTPFAICNKTNLNRGLIETTKLEPENEYGNVEYKLKLTDPSPDRIERLVTQLKWRIREGHGEAILFLGVKDNGLFVGLTPEEAKLSLQTLERMSAKIGAKMTVVREKIIENDQAEELFMDCQSLNAKGKVIRNRAAYSKFHKENMRASTMDYNVESRGKKSSSNKPQRKQPAQRKVLQILVKRKTHDISEELRIAVLGSTESGKSSLLGVLSHGEKDNGRGSARLNLFRHRHEIRSGHTSSISQEIFGFNVHGEPLTYSTCLSTEEIIESSSKIVTVIDLAGHQRYLSTTLFGLGSHSPDLVLIVVNVTSTITSETTDHISLVLAMDKSLAIVINKIDLATKEDQDVCHSNIVDALQIINPEISTFKISNLNDAAMAGSRLRESKSVPIFFTSCVSGVGWDNLYTFFNQISPKLNSNDLDNAMNKTSELQVDETFKVPGIGTVVSGLVVEGIVREGDELLLGPDDQGRFSNVSVISLHRHKIPCNFVCAGQKCTMAIRTNDVSVRPGMVMKEMDHNWNNTFSVCSKFEVNIKVITSRQQKLSPGSQVSVYVGNVKQTCSVMWISPTISNNYSVKLQLTKRPEYIRLGSRVIIRHALTKGVGVVSRVVPINREEKCSENIND